MSNLIIDSLETWYNEGLLSFEDVVRLIQGQNNNTTGETADITEEYSVVSMFYEEFISSYPYETVSASTLYEYYVNWCNINGHEPMTSAMFGRLIKNLGVKWKRTSKGIVYSICK